MRKSSLFLSAVLSAFMLAVMAGVITAYRSVAGGGTNPGTSISQATQPVVASAPDIGGKQAASIAATYLGRSDLFSVEPVTLNGTDAYLVTFSNGDLVYVSPQGQVLAYSPSITAGVSAPNFSPSSPPASNGDHENGDDD